MDAEFLTTGTEYYTACLDELEPLELVKHAKSVLLMLADGHQPQRDTVCRALMENVDKRCQSALEKGDVGVYMKYSRARRFVSKYVELYGKGPNFGHLGPEGRS
jgi:hypothetical protein